jgi:hypothetical protein
MLPSQQCYYPHKLSSIAKLVAHVTVVIQWEFTYMLTIMVSLKRVVKFTQQLTQISSNAVRFNSVPIAHLAEVVGQ